jgi:hypothetical protein
MKRIVCLAVALAIGSVMLVGCKKKEEPAVKVDTKAMNESMQKANDAAAKAAQSAADAAKQTTDAVKNMVPKSAK